MTALDEVVTDWVGDLVTAFRTAEHAYTDLHAERDPALVRYVLKALAEGGCPATASVLEDIDRARASVMT